MQRKTPDKFLVGKGHLFFYRTAFVILVGESHRVFINRFDAVVADSDFMRVSPRYSITDFELPKGCLA